MPQNFTEVAVLRGADGVVIPVTARFRDGNLDLTFSVQREFDRGGKVERTAWMGRRHLEAAQRLIAEQLPAFLDKVEDEVRAKRRAG